MKKLLALTLVSVMLLTAGCQSTSSPKKQVEGNKKTDEAILYLGSLGEPAMGFDPILGWANVDGTSIFHSNLLKQDEDMGISPDLAKEYKISDDGKSYAFKLRDDAKFSDGTAVTSGDVAFTYQKSADSGYVGNLDKITEIETPDDKTVIIHLSEANSLFIYSVIRLGIVPEKGYDNGYGKHPIGTGPYKLVQWDAGQQLIVEANPEYYGKQPALKKLTFLFLGEEAAFEAAKNGTLDFYFVPSAYVSQEIKGMDLVSYQCADLLNIGLSFPKKNAITRDDGLSVGNDVTQDIAIRKAINVGINRQELVDGILEGYGRPAYDLVDPSMPWYNKETAYTDNDVEKAKKTLEDGGWKDTNGDGIVEKDGIKAEITILASSDSKTYQGIAMATAEMMKRFGIMGNVETKSWDEIDTLIYTQPYVLGWGSKDPIDIFFIYFSGNSGKGYYNSGYYKNETVDNYINLALNASAPEEVNEYWKKAQWDGQTGFSTRGDASWLWLVSPDHVYRLKHGLNVGKQGLQNPSMGWALLHNITEWTWDE